MPLSLAGKLFAANLCINHSAILLSKLYHFLLHYCLRSGCKRRLLAKFPQFFATVHLTFTRNDGKFRKVNPGVMLIGAVFLGAKAPLEIALVHNHDMCRHDLHMLPHDLHMLPLIVIKMLSLFKT